MTHNPQFTSTHRGPDKAGRSRQSFVHSFSIVSCMQQYGNIDESAVREDYRCTVFLVRSDGVDPRGGKARLQFGAPLCRGALKFGFSSRSLSLFLSSALSRPLVPERKSHVKRKLASWLCTGQPSSRVGKSLATRISIQPRSHIPGGDSNLSSNH